MGSVVTGGLRVDAAVHVWSDERVAFPFAPLDQHELPEMPGSTELLLTTLEAAGWSGAVCVQPRVYGYDHGYLHESVAAHPGRLAGVVLVNPTRASGPQELRWHVRDHAMAGVRLLPAAADDPAWLVGTSGDPLWECAAELGIPVSVLARPDQVGHVWDRARRTPEVTVVLDHLGLVTDPGDSTLGVLLAGADLPNTVVKVSALTVLAAESAAEPVAEVARAVFAAYGPERVAYGTDWPYATDRGPWDAGLGILRRALGDDADDPRLLGGTAARVWGLTGAES